jgi:hypothetical protein
MLPIRQIAVALLAVLAAAGSLRAQQPAANGADLPVTRCDASANTCAEEARTFTAPVLGASGQATMLSPSRRAPQAVLEGADEQQVPVPGCGQVSPGTLRCGMIQDYQHCRTLMISSMVDSCRIEVAFASGAIVPQAAEPGDYDLAIESDARVRIARDERGFGQVRGAASVEIRFELPAEAAPPAWCVQRDRYLYFATGPQGGLPEIDDSGDCDSPLSFDFKPHADDLLRAWDLCETFAAWGEELRDSIEILAAAIFHVRSSAPSFNARYRDGAAAIARYATVTAPLTIECRN